MSEKSYVVGFMLDQAREHVVLIEKNRPAWQAGKLNGVGGKVEPGEFPVNAMQPRRKEKPRGGGRPGSDRSPKEAPDVRDTTRYAEHRTTTVRTGNVRRTGGLVE